MEANGGGKGGAVYSVGGSVSLTGCTLSDNHTDFGGAVYDTNTVMTVSGCTLSGNWATVEGSAIYNNSTATTLKKGKSTTNLTVSNTAFSGNYVYIFGVNYSQSYTIVGPWTNGGGNTFN